MPEVPWRISFQDEGPKFMFVAERINAAAKARETRQLCSCAVAGEHVMRVAVLNDISTSYDSP